MATRRGYEGVAVCAPVTVPYTRFLQQTAHWWCARALGALAGRAQLRSADIDGFCLSSFSLAPGTAVGLVQHLGLSPRWLDHIPMGGASGVIALRRAARAVQAGDASIVAFEVNVHGLARLAQAFGHTMRARGADGQNSAAAIVDILPAHALVNAPVYGAFCASAAARHSLLQCLRAEMRSGGVRVTGIYSGPLDETWRQELPPPKVTPKQIADAVVLALKDGLEEVAVGDVARDILARYLADPKTLEREISR